MKGIVGRPILRYDGLQHVTGTTAFVDDVRVKGTLWVKVFRSPVPRGQIRSLDVTRAERLPGVAGVITHKDVPNNIYGLLTAAGVPADEPVLAEHEVRYRGQPIAAVAAADEETAAEAASLIRADIEAQEPVLDMLRAIEPGAPQVTPGGNLYNYGPVPYRRIRAGDVEQGFARADEMIEGVYEPHPVEHAPLETQTALVVPEASGRITVYSVSQAIYWNMGHVAGILGIPFSKIRFVGGTVGGGFGGKTDALVEPITAVLALKTGRPCKWRWSREEEFLASSIRAGWRLEFRDGVTRDGRIVARKIRTLHDCGAYSRLSPYAINKHSFYVSGPYAIPNVWVDAYVVYTNRQPSSAMRGFGVTSASFACEMQMDRIARTLGIDPWELRFRNAHREGDTSCYGKTLKSVSLIEAMQAVARAAGMGLPAHLMAMRSAGGRAEA